MFIDKNGVVRMPKAYLAGTEIFYTDSDETQEKYHQLCDKYGIIGYYPPDIAPEDEFKEYVKKDDSLHEMELQLFTHDLNQIKRTDIIIANLNDYRGNEPDSGTAVECGIAWGYGHRCFAFIDDARPMKERFKGVKKVREDGTVTDKDGNSKKFTVKTDSKTVGEALQAVEIIHGDMGDYGLYVKEVNGIVADYDIDGTYWAFYVDGAYAMSGVDTTDVVAGSNYEFKVEK